MIFWFSLKMKDSQKGPYSSAIKWRAAKYCLLYLPRAVFTLIAFTKSLFSCDSSLLSSTRDAVVEILTVAH